MGQGHTAYESFVRIHEEMGSSAPPDWDSLSHVGRMAWEAAAQAVASEFLPGLIESDLCDEDLDDDVDDENLTEDEVLAGLADDIQSLE
jgi:hypothetical protein